MLIRAVRANHELYDQPTRRVMGRTENVLKKAISLLLKCRGIKRVFASIITSASFQDISSQLEQSIGNIAWLLRDDMYRGLPPIAADEPVLCNIWELIAVLHTGSVEDQCSAVASLVSLARESDSYVKLIIEEGGGIQPMLRLVQEGTPEAQKHAVTIIVLIGKENGHVIDDMVSSVFMRILEEGPPTKLQGTVAWAVSELAEIFDDYDAYKLVHLLGNLAFKTLSEDSNIRLAHGVSVVGASLRGTDLGNDSYISLSRGSNRVTEMQDHEIDEYMKGMATRALWNLAVADTWSCQIITESTALMCFAFFLDRGPEEARYNSAMALMEITAVTKPGTKLRKSAFKPNLYAVYKAVVDQLFRIIDHHAESEILVPCVKVIGNLACEFETTETRMIHPLVKLLDEREPEVSMEACTALINLAHPDNLSCVEQSKTVVDCGGLKVLILFVMWRGMIVQRRSALTLLCYTAMNMPRSGKLAEAKVLSILKSASKLASFMQDEDIRSLLPKAISAITTS